MESNDTPKVPESAVCLRCGRKLKSKESQERRMGETCYKKAMAGKKHHKLLFRSLHPSE